jgi:phosphopantothenoylcysteine decarboxylase/phosphopantothenate--cysteine ligase
VAKKKLNILITAGGTREYIDPVRFISNASSGKMGFALAKAAVKAGHNVTLIAANTDLRVPKGVKVIDVVTSGQMYKVVNAEFKDCGCLIMAAAVSDYRPATSTQHKIKKDQSEMILKLKPTQDILKSVAKSKKASQIVVGFALEDRMLLKNAEKKLKAKNLDMIVANEPTAIGADTSTIHIKTKDGDWQAFENVTKDASARQIIRCVGQLIG